MPNSGEIPSLIIDADLARLLIAAQFPQWSHLPVTAVEPGGHDNRTFRLGHRMSVRLPSARAYVSQVEKEHEWLPRLAPHVPLPIPVPLAKGAPDKNYPWPWSVYGWLDGAPAVKDRIFDLNGFARSLAGFLAALHRIDPIGGPPAGEENFHRGGRLAVYDAETQSALSILTGRVDTVTAGAIWAAALSSEWKGSPRWIHGDLSFGNLLVKDGAICAVIDFGCSAVGDPACDLVIAWTFLSGESREAFRAALPLDTGTWARARGWALWKTLITAANQGTDQVAIEQAWQVMDEIVTDYRRQSSI